MWRRAQVEPVLRVGRHGQEIARYAPDRKYFVLGYLIVKPKEAFALNEKSNLIFAMGMFAKKLIPDGGQIGRRGPDPDHIGSAISVFVHERLEPVVMGLQDLGVAQTDLRGFGSPMVIRDGPFLEKMANLVFFSQIDLSIGYS